MQKILIVISKGIMRRNILDTEFWPKVQADNPDCSFVIVAEPEQVEHIEKAYGSEWVSVRGYERIKGGLFWRLAHFGVRTCLNTHSAQRYRMMAHELGHASWIATQIKTFISNILAPRSWYKTLVRKFLLLCMRSLEISRIFEEEKPDLLFAPSLIDNDFDIPFAAEAKRRGVRIIGMVRSWDNPTSHSLIGVVPDKMLYQNAWLKRIITGPYQEAGTDATDESDVIGIPHYDPYKDPEQFTVPREEYFKMKGLDPAKKLIFIGGSQLYRSGYILPGVFERLIEEEKIHGPIQVLFRPHPKHIFSLDDYGLEGMRHVVLDEGSQSRVQFSDAQNFVNGLYHADVVVGISSTITIDGAVFGKPVIDICFDDPEKEVGYWESVERLFDTEDHYERVVELEGSRVAKSLEEVAHHANVYLDDPTDHAEGRKRIIDEFVEPFDGHASDRLAKAVTAEIRHIA